MHVVIILPDPRKSQRCSPTQCSQCSTHCLKMAFHKQMSLEHGWGSGGPLNKHILTEGCIHQESEKRNRWVRALPFFKWRADQTQTCTSCDPEAEWWAKHFKSWLAMTFYCATQAGSCSKVITMTRIRYARPMTPGWPQILPWWHKNRLESHTVAAALIYLVDVSGHVSSHRKADRKEVGEFLRRLDCKWRWTTLAILHNYIISHVRSPTALFI